MQNYGMEVHSRYLQTCHFSHHSSITEGFHAFARMLIHSRVLIHIFALICSHNAFNSPMSAFVAGQPTPRPCSESGFGIIWKCTYQEQPVRLNSSNARARIQNESTYMIDFLMCQPSVVLQNIVVLSTTCSGYLLCHSLFQALVSHSCL